MHVRRARTIDLSAVRNVHRHPVSALQVCSTAHLPSKLWFSQPYPASALSDTLHPCPSSRRAKGGEYGDRSGRRASRIGQEGASVGDVNSAQNAGAREHAGRRLYAERRDEDIAEEDEERPLRGTLTLGD